MATRLHLCPVPSPTRPLLTAQPSPICHSPPTPSPQDFVTGPANGATYGYFAVDHATGEGYALATDTWADSPEEPAAEHCVDTWTLAPVKVPVGGLTPYPSEAQGQPDWAAQVVITPVSLLTLGGTAGTGGNGSVAARYDAAHAALGVDPKGGLYGRGMMNSDPMAMLASGNPAKVGVGFRAIAAAAKVLTTLATARALYECREQDAARLSNELFFEVRGGRGGGGREGRAARGGRAAPARWRGALRRGALPGSSPLTHSPLPLPSRSRLAVVQRAAQARDLRL
jgi:hypothetical protein